MQLCVLNGKTVTYVSYIINRLGFITEVEIVYCVVRTENLNNTYVASLKGSYINLTCEMFKVHEIYKISAVITIMWILRPKG